MKTGIVVNNYDPTFKNRCQIRVNGLHTQKVGGQYVIIDDDQDILYGQKDNFIHINSITGITQEDIDNF